MSNRDALRRLSKKFPAPPELLAALEALSNEPDLTVAVMGTALLETGLERLIVVQLQTNRKDLPGRLFENRGPLSDFNSKILVAEAFGIINSQIADELQIIRHIRNTFAHARMPVTFATPEIAKEVDQFGMLNVMKGVEENFEDGTKPFSAIPKKRAFLLIIQLLFYMIDGAHFKITGKTLVGSAPRPSPEK